MSRVQLLRCSRVLIVLAGAAFMIHAQQPTKSDPKGPDTAKGQEVTMTGCLTRSSGAGDYTLTDPQNGTQTAVRGSADLEKHAANHTVRLTGTRSTEAGKTMLNVTKIDHINDNCQPSSTAKKQQ